jgi:hypothetical protein
MGTCIAHVHSNSPQARSTWPSGQQSQTFRATPEQPPLSDGEQQRQQRGGDGCPGLVELRAERDPAGPDGALGARRAGQDQGRDGCRRRRREAGDPDGPRRPVGVPVLPDGAGSRGRRRRRSPVRRVQLLLHLRRP